jgi:hypothetical protein
MSKKFAIGILGLALFLGLQTESASAFTPTTSMIKKACVQLSKGFEPKLNSIKPKLALRAEQLDIWQKFSEKVKATSQPVVSLCKEKFGPNSPEPGWFAKTAERQKANEDRALFMKTMDDMGGGMNAAMSILSSGLSPEQLKTAQELMRMEM